MVLWLTDHPTPNSTSSNGKRSHALNKCIIVDDVRIRIWWRLFTAFARDTNDTLAKFDCFICMLLLPLWLSFHELTSNNCFPNMSMSWRYMCKPMSLELRLSDNGGTAKGIRDSSDEVDDKGSVTHASNHLLCFCYLPFLIASFIRQAKGPKFISTKHQKSHEEVLQRNKRSFSVVALSASNFRNRTKCRLWVETPHISALVSTTECK